MIRQAELVADNRALHKPLFAGPCIDHPFIAARYQPVLRRACTMRQELREAGKLDAAPDPVPWQPTVEETAAEAYHMLFRVVARWLIRGWHVSQLAACINASTSKRTVEVCVFPRAALDPNLFAYAPAHWLPVVIARDHLLHAIDARWCFFVNAPGGAA